MDAVLERLQERHGTYGVDWMGFNLSRKNPLTYHHIKKNCEKGKRTLENGAPLTKQAHTFLNCLERTKPDLYVEWNELFKEINKSEAPPTEEHIEKIKVLRKKGEIIEKSFMNRK